MSDAEHDDDPIAFDWCGTLADTLSLVGILSEEMVKDFISNAPGPGPQKKQKEK